MAFATKQAFLKPLAIMQKLITSAKPEVQVLITLPKTCISAPDENDCSYG